MKWPVRLLIAAGSLGTAVAATVGETYEQVIAEKGKPTSHLEAGAVQILTYPDAVIKLRDNVVVGVKAPEASPPPPAAPAPRPAAAPMPAAPAAAVPDGAPMRMLWTNNYNFAVEKARTEHKHVFLFFTGSDWCGWCMKLDEEVLHTPEFAQYAQQKMILVEVDFPRQKQLSDDLRRQNRLLAEHFGIKGYPTVVVLDSEGRPAGRLGYQPGGPGPFIAQLQSIPD